MKKFTKIILIIAAVLAILGLLCSGIASAMGAGWAVVHQKALKGEFDIGNWHFGDGIYYSSSKSSDGDWDEDDDCDEDEDMDEDDDLDKEDDWDDLAEDVGSWISDLASIETAPTGKESQTETYPAAGITTMELKLDVVSEVQFVDAGSTDSIRIDMQDGYQKYFDTEKQGSTLTVTYDSKKHYSKNGPTITVALPTDSSGLDVSVKIGTGETELTAVSIGALTVSTGVGDVTVEQTTVRGNVNLKLGTGDADLTGVSCVEAQIESGAGDTCFDGTVSERIKVVNGTGDVDVTLPGKEENYQYDLSTGVGEITLNSRSRGAAAAKYKTDGTGIAVDLSTGVGDIDVETN